MPSSLSVRVRRALPPVRLTRRRVVAGAVVLAVLVALVGWAVWPQATGYRVRDAMMTVRSGPSGDQTITLDTRLYLPSGADAGHRVPAVLLAHGFGGTKLDVADQAGKLADRGYAVLTWTAEGFGRSSGQIHLDSPDWEVRDARGLVDWLAGQPQIRLDGPGDPRVAAVGGSYGGGLALLLAAYDHRVDAIVPSITWNDLTTAFLPNAASGGPDADGGVFKKQWAGLFFGTGGRGAAAPDPAVAASAEGPDPGRSGPGDGAATGAGTGPAAGERSAQCGRFALDVCQAYLELATTGQAGAQSAALLRRSSPAGVIGDVRAPTLLIQGAADSLFPLSEADANARGIARNGVPVQVAWFTGGHDGGAGPQSDQDRLDYLTLHWLDHYLRGRGAAPGTDFTYSRITGIDASGEGLRAAGFSTGGYPGPAGQARSTVAVLGRPQRIANPPGGTPAALSTLPGTGTSGVSSVTSRLTAEVPGQHADFVSAPLAGDLDVVGSPTVSIRAASPTGSATVFVKLYDVDPKAGAVLPDGLVAPVRLTGLPASLDHAAPHLVTLPAIVYRFAAGHRLRITVASADQAFSSPPEPAVYTVAAAGPVTLPTVHGTPLATPSVIWRYALYALLVAIAAGLVVAIAVGRARLRRRSGTDPRYADTPLVVRGLRKAYADGFVAVRGVDFTVSRDTVVGLLGPNGAGKTTTLRVLMGLTYPTAGEVFVFGQPLTPGAPVLTRVGALVEGPGFLPHLSGLANLTLYWKATGRPAEAARLERVLEIADLGPAIHRRVKTYSHGMKQRLAIAQAMLGLPELLVLDEPTDGLDPPQIAQMRRVLSRYATEGRAVLVSSHLLAEVEQTCTDVVVMHKGEVVAAGPVADIVGDSPTVQLGVSDADRAARVLDQLAAVRSVSRGGDGGLVVDVDGTPRADVVAALVRAGVGVDRVVPRRRLEDAFLALVSGDGGTETKDGAQ